MSESEPIEDGPESFEEVSRSGNVVTRTLPWIVAISIFAYILSSTDLDGLRASAASAHWGHFWVVAFSLYAVIFATDSFTVWWMYRRFHVPTIRYRDVLPARGASYFLGILNYAAGSAAMAFYFKKRFRVGFLEGGASLLLLMLVDLGLVTVAVLIGGSMLPDVWTEATVATLGGVTLTWNTVIRVLAGLFVLGAAAHMLFWRAPWKWGPLERIRQIPSLAGFRRATVIDYLKIGLIRAPVTVLYILMHGFTLTAFHIQVPWAQMMVFVPIQMLIAVVPISPSGLGTVNLAQRLLYAPYVYSSEGDHLVAEAATSSIDAYGLALALAFNIPRLVIGFVALRAAKRALQSVALADQESQ
jgi:hypothetical protein